MGVKSIRSDMTCTIRWKIFGQWPMATMVPAILYRKRQRWQEIVSEARTLAEDWFEALPIVGSLFPQTDKHCFFSRMKRDRSEKFIWWFLSKARQTNFQLPVETCQNKIQIRQLSNISPWPTYRDRRKMEWKQMQILIVEIVWNKHWKYPVMATRQIERSPIKFYDHTCCHLPTDLSPNFSVPTSVKAKPLLFSICISADRKIHSIKLQWKGVGNWQGPRATNTRVGFRYNTEIFYQEIRLNVTTFWHK